jgi:phosphate transport system protein
MSHYEQRLEKDLDTIRSEVHQMASRVEYAVQNSIHALMTTNQDLANSVILGDGPINRQMRSIDTLCHQFIAVHLPSAGHLRLISSVIRINIILERIGDYAVTISRELRHVTDAPHGHQAQGIELLAGEVRRMLHQAITAFDEDNAQLARGTIAMSSQIDNIVTNLYKDLLDETDGQPLTEKFAVFSVYHRLERIADQAKNLCEQTIFTVLGEGKASKVYQILFVDDDNSCMSKLAEAIARKHFPESGEYISAAGRKPASALSPGLVGFMDSLGMSVVDTKPKRLDLTAAELSRFHVIISLQGPADAYIANPPFKTTLLNWELASLADKDSSSDQQYEKLHRELSVRIKDVMNLLRGEGAR